MKRIDLNLLRDRIYKDVCEQGLHNNELSNEHFLCLVISELMKAVEVDRGNRYNKRAKVDWFNKRIETSRIYKDTALEKLVYLAYRNVRKKWTMPIANWAIIAQQLAIKFGDRLILI